MKSPQRILAALAVTLAGAPLAMSQGWFNQCLDPDRDDWYSDDYGIFRIGDSLIGVSLGLSGTVDYGGPNGPCYGPAARTLEASGRMAFWVGNEGSIQSNFDDGLALTTGAPRDPVGDFCYTKILKDGNTNAASVLYGEGGLRVAYVGASKRYAVTAWNDADVDVECLTKVVGDAVRLRWRMRNLKADPQTLGMLFGCYTGQLSSTPDSIGATQAHSPIPTRSGRRKYFDILTDRYIGWTALSNGKPVRTERRYGLTSPNFPASMRFEFGQTDAYGIRVDNLPGSETPDATSTDLCLIGNYGDTASPGLTHDNNMRLRVFTDVDSNPNPLEEADILMRETAFIQRFAPVTVQSGDTRDIVHYIRSSWGVSDYEDPYTAVLDGPRLISTNSTGQNGLTPNPFTIRAYVDNQYATIDKEVDLHNVKFTVFLPTGLKLAAGESQQKTIDLISANGIGHIDWRVVADGKVFGNLPYSVSIAPNPGPTKTLNASVRVSSTPKLNLPTGANLVTIPYNFSDTSMEKILGLKAGEDYIAYRWDAETSGYIAAISVERGRGYWVLPTSDKGYLALVNAIQPTDQAQGGLLVTMKQGWNLIGNPYTYSVPLNQLVLVAEDNPKDAVTWNDAVANNYVQSSMVFWERDGSLTGGQYIYTKGQNDLLEPHRGYWVYVSTAKALRLQWPPVFAEGLPGSGRSPEADWVQSDRQWRLQLSARTNSNIDSDNYVGVVTDKKKAKQLLLRKAPTSPNQAVEISIREDVDGKSTKLSQVFAQRAARKDWNIEVKVKQVGDITVTWPNLPSIPRNMRFRLMDLATNQSTDLRSTSGYTFRANEEGVRKFKLTMEPGGSTRAVIGNVLVTRPNRSAGANAPVNISYALSSDAMVTVRVLNNQGKEVYTVTRGRADKSGQNSVTWTMRDNANRTVAAGVYRVEILAETPNGERVRRMVPVNVTR